MELQSIAELKENKLDEKFSEFQAMLEKYALKEDAVKLQANIRSNYYNNSKMEQYTRRDNLRIHGWRYDPNMNLTGHVVKLLNHAVNLKSDQNEELVPVAAFKVDDISICHLIKPKAGVKQQVIVRFVSRSKLHEAFRVKNFLKKS